MATHGPTTSNPPRRRRRGRREGGKHGEGRKKIVYKPPTHLQPKASDHHGGWKETDNR
jgi:hypothetical protein